MGDVRPPWEERPGEIDLAVFGHINLDHFLHVEALPQADRTVPVSRQVTHLGGTATNLARSAAAWGVRTGIISRVGDDFPPEYWRLLEEENIDLSGVERVRGVGSSCCYIVEDGRGGQMTLIDQGPMGPGRTPWIPAERLERAHWLHLATGDPALQLRLAAAARRLGVHVSVDPAQEIHYLWDGARFRKLLDGAEALFGNTAEIDRAVSLLGARTRARLLEHVPLVVETRGARGAAAYTRAGTERVAAIAPARFAQVTGAGDAFRGGFFAAWFAGQTLRHCLVAGTRSAARWMSNGSRTPLGRRGGPGRP